jgi:hypothetical protein
MALCGNLAKYVQSPLTVPRDDYKGRLALIDQLIDQIVYRLYGLTEVEVAVVQGKA